MIKFYKFVGIGEASASMALAALSANPTFAPLATGFIGRVTFFILKGVFMLMASIGLIVLNIGAAKIETIIDKGDFDGSWDTAEAAINAIRNAGREMTPEEIAAIDEPVKATFRKFGRFGKTKSTKAPK